MLKRFSSLSRLGGHVSHIYLSSKRRFTIDASCFIGCGYKSRWHAISSQREMRRYRPPRLADFIKSCANGARAIGDYYFVLSPTITLHRDWRRRSHSSRPAISMRPYHAPTGRPSPNHCSSRRYLNSHCSALTSAKCRPFFILLFAQILIVRRLVIYSDIAHRHHHYFMSSAPT